MIGMHDPDHYDKLSSVQKTMVFILFLCVAVGTLLIVAHMSWLGSIGSIFETVGPDDFKTTEVTMEERDGNYVYTSTFSHTGWTSIETSRLSVSISIVSEGDLRQFSPSVQKGTTRFEDYTVITDGFLSKEKTDKVDTGSVTIKSPRKLDNLSVCVLYVGQPVACSGENKLTGN